MLLEAILIQVLPVISMIIMLILGKKHQDKGPLISIALISASFLLALHLASKIYAGSVAEYKTIWFTIGTYNVDVGILLDPLTAVMMVVITLVATMCQIYSVGYLKGDIRLNWFYAAMSLFSTAMLMLVFANNYLQLIIGWELVGLCSYFLIGFWFERDYAPPAASKAMIVTRLADLPFVLGIILLFMNFGSFNMTDIFKGAEALNLGEATLISAKALAMSNGQVITLIAICLFIGAMGKSAQVPFHTWLPDAMAGPSPVSALIHAATMVVAGVYLVARSLPFFDLSPSTLTLVAYVGVITALVSGIIGIAQHDLKRIVAYSTLGSIGLMMMAVGVHGLGAGMFYLWAHAFFKALLFLSAGSIIHAAHTMDIREIGGVYKKMKISFWFFIIGALSLAGIPPLSGFWAKDEMLLAVYDSGHIDILIIALIAIALTTMFIFRLIFIAFFGDEKEGQHLHESPKVMVGPMSVLAFLAIFAGFVGSPLMNMAFMKFVQPEHHVEPNYMIMGVAVLVSVSALLFSYLLYGKKIIPMEPFKVLRPIRVFAEKKLYFDELYHHAFVRPTIGMGQVIASFDRKVIDGIVNGVGKVVMGGGIRFRHIQMGYLQNYAIAMVAMIVFMVIFGLNSN